MPEDNSPQDPGTDGPTKVVKVPTASSNPFYGCAILIIAAVTFGFMVGWTLYSGWKQNQEISTFTVQDAPPLPASTVDEAEKAALKAKLISFAAVANAGNPVALTLTTDDLNTLITLAAEHDEKTDYRGIVHFTGLDPGAKLFKADIRWKMNNLPLVKAPDRFLVGQATFKPVIENGALELHLENIHVPGKSVSEGFLVHLRNMPWLNVAKLKPEIKNPLGKVSQFDFSNDGSVFALHCGATTE